MMRGASRGLGAGGMAHTAEYTGHLCIEQGEWHNELKNLVDFRNQ